MEAMSTLAMLCCSAAVVLGLIALTIRFDPAAAARRRQHEQHVRRGTAALLRDAQRALREHTR